MSILVFVVVAVAARRDGAFWWAVAGYVGAAIGAASLGLLCADWPLVSDKLPVLSELTDQLAVRLRIRLRLHPNTLAGTLLWPLPLLLVLPVIILRQRTRLRRKLGSAGQRVTMAIAVAGGMLVLAVFVLTQSRSAYLGLTVTLLAVGLLYGGSRLRWGIGGFLLLIGVALAVLAPRVRNGEDGDTAFLVPQSLQARTEIWTRAVSLAAQRPLTGIGMNSFAHVVHRMRPFGHSRIERERVAPDERIGHAHDLYLQTILDIGVVGLMALLALYAACLSMAREVWKNHPDQAARCIAGALGVGLIAHALFGLVDAVSLGEKAGVIFWVHVGLVWALYARLRPGQKAL